MEYNYKYELGSSLKTNENTFFILMRVILKDKEDRIYYLLLHNNIEGTFDSSFVESQFGFSNYLDLEIVGNISDYYGKMVRWESERWLQIHNAQVIE